VGVYGGPADWWTDGTDAGRTHIATKGVVQSGLVLNLDAGVSSSYPGIGTSWTNLVGGGNNGTLVNGVGYNSANGGSLSFDGVNDYVRIPYNPAFNVTSNPFTVIVWNKKNTTTNGFNGLITADAASDNTWKIFKDTGVTYYKTRSGTTTLDFPNYVVGQWHMYAFTKFSNILTNYFDGTLVSSKIPSSDPVSFSNDLALGSYRLNDAISGFYLMNQNFSVVMFYNRALTASEIQQNFNATRSRFSI
jgi:hypothetical protein